MKSVLCAALAAFALTACGGFGSQKLLPMAAPEMQSTADSVGATATAVSVHVVIRVPAAALTAKSLSVSVNNGAAVVTNVSSGASGCVSATSTQPLTCTISISAPAAVDLFTVKTYSAAGGTGTLLSSGTILQSVSATSGATIPVALAGSIAGLSVQLGRANATECALAITTPVYVRAKDAQGNIIITSRYTTAVSLHDSDASGATKLSTTSLLGSSTGVTLSYNGNKIGPSAAITAAATGVASTASTGAALNIMQQLYVLDANNQYVQVFSPVANGNVAPSRVFNERGRMTPQAREIAVSKTCTLYAADGGNNSIFAFPAGGNGAVAPVATINGSSTMLNGPQGVAVDASGKIYAPIYNSVSRQGGIGVWNAGSSGNVAPAATIIGTNTQVGHPASIAFDAAGNMYVLDFRKVVVFAKGATGNATPLRVLLTPSLYCETGMNVDASGKIYITDCSNTITVYAAGASGNSAPLRVINTGASTGPAGVGIDYRNNVFTVLQRLPAIASYSSSAAITTPLTKITGTATTLNLPFDVAL